MLKSLLGSNDFNVSSDWLATLLPAHRKPLASGGLDISYQITWILTWTVFSDKGS